MDTAPPRPAYLRRLDSDTFAQLPGARPDRILPSEDPTAGDPDEAHWIGPLRGLRYEPAPAEPPEVTVPPGYTWAPLIRWGDPVVAGAPAFDPATPDAAAQQEQFGFHCGGLCLVDLPGHAGLTALVVGHDRIDPSTMFAGYDAADPDRVHLRAARAALGISVVILERDSRTGRLLRVPGHELNRRETTNSLVEFTGPAADSPLVRVSFDRFTGPGQGTLGNAGGGATPWHTALSGERHFAPYFGASPSAVDPGTAAVLARYGVAPATEYQWEDTNVRFDASSVNSAVSQFGWVVEIDPMDAELMPRKRTALGRFSHVDAEPRLARDGRVVVYMGDDGDGEYLYKYVSTGAFDSGPSAAARRHNLRLLDEGTLYVARFRLGGEQGFDGIGEWLPLASGNQSLVEGMHADEVYVHTRLAADAISATRLDRPSDVVPSPRSGAVHVVTSGRITDLAEVGGNWAATEFRWRESVRCCDPAARTATSSPCPGTVCVDLYGTLWFTDGGLVGVPIEGLHRGKARPLVAVPRGAEAFDPVLGARGAVLAVQHLVDAEEPGTLDRPGVVVVYPVGHGRLGD